MTRHKWDDNSFNLLAHISPQALTIMDFVSQYVLHRCPVCRSHAECPVRVGWRLGPIILCGYFHVNERGDVEAIHITSLYKPVQQVNAEADRNADAAGNVNHAFTQRDAVVVLPLIPAEQQQVAADDEFNVDDVEQRAWASDDDEVNADLAPGIWTA